MKPKTNIITNAFEQNGGALFCCCQYC